jgi:hypothetical protein
MRPCAATIPMPFVVRRRRARGAVVRAVVVTTGMVA